MREWQKWGVNIKSGAVKPDLENIFSHWMNANSKFHRFLNHNGLFFFLPVLTNSAIGLTLITISCSCTEFLKTYHSKDLYAECFGTSYPLDNYKRSCWKGANKVSINIRIHVFSNNKLIYILNMKWLKTFLRATRRPPFLIQNKQRFSIVRTKFIIKSVLAHSSNSK